MQVQLQLHFPVLAIKQKLCQSKALVPSSSLFRSQRQAVAGAHCSRVPTTHSHTTYRPTWDIMFCTPGCCTKASWRSSSLWSLLVKLVNKEREVWLSNPLSCLANMSKALGSPQQAHADRAFIVRHSLAVHASGLVQWLRRGKTNASPCDKKTHTERLTVWGVVRCLDSLGCVGCLLCHPVTWARLVGQGIANPASFCWGAISRR